MMAFTPSSGLSLGLLSLFAALARGVKPEFEQHEKKLYHDLMRDYQKWVRPVIRSDDTVTVEFGITFQGLLAVNENEGYVSLNTWWNMRWEDVSLRWNSSDYFGIEKVRLPIDKLWSPDLYVYNSIGDERIFKQGMAVVNSRGVTSYIPPFIVNIACKFDFTYYPYDEQTCIMKIGSWHHDGGKINLTTTHKTADTSTFSNFNSKWIIKNMMIPVKRNVIKYECCPELYIDITATFTIARQATYVTSVLVVPGVILAFLIPFVFMFPPDAGEKINLGVGLILGYILLLLIGDTISQGAMMASPPMIFRYYSVNIVLVGLSMIISMIVVQLWRDRGRATGPPHFLSTILVNSIGGLLCVRRENYKRRPRTVTIDTEGGMDTDKIGQDGPDPNLEWRLVAMVLDRILFIIFLVITIIVASVML